MELPLDLVIGEGAVLHDEFDDVSVVVEHHLDARSPACSKVAELDQPIADGLGLGPCGAVGVAHFAVADDDPRGRELVHDGGPYHHPDPDRGHPETNRERCQTDARRSPALATAAAGLYVTVVGGALERLCERAHPEDRAAMRWLADAVN